MAGYSQKPLRDKLGIKPDSLLVASNSPKPYAEIVHGVTFQTQLSSDEKADIIHFFTDNRQQLQHEFPSLKAGIKTNGMLWISWPKVQSAIPTDLNENIVREIGLASGLVDVKVAAIDETWSGLKFVYRIKDRI